MLDREIDQRIVRDHEIPRVFTKLPSCCSCFSQLLSIFLTSLKIIFLQNPKLFLSIYVFTCLPLSLLLTSLSLSSRHLRAHIARLEWLANAIDIVIESENIEDEAREELSSLLRLKAFYCVPICLFSLLSLIATVSAALKKRPQLGTVVATALTSVVNCGVWITWAVLTWAVATVVGHGAATTSNWAVAAVGTAVEVYLMAVLSLALVVTVAEEVAGVATVRTGWGLMMREGWVVGWALSSLVLVGSSCIWREMKGAMDGRDFSLSEEYEDQWTVRMRYGYMGGLVMLLGWLILWSFVVFTVFYGDCKKRLVANRDRD